MLPPTHERVALVYQSTVQWTIKVMTPASMYLLWNQGSWLLWPTVHLVGAKVGNRNVLVCRRLPKRIYQSMSEYIDVRPVIHKTGNDFLNIVVSWSHHQPTLFVGWSSFSGRYFFTVSVTGIAALAVAIYFRWLVQHIPMISSVRR